MTIRFLKQWNGYSDQSVVSFNSVEELRLVNQGLAEFVRPNKKDRKIYFIGDSIAAHCFNVPATTANSISVFDGICTLDWGATFDPMPGMRFMIDNTADNELNLRMCTVVASLTRNKFTFTVDGYTPDDGTITKSASNISAIYVNSRSVLNPAVFANAKLGGYFEFAGISARSGARVDEIAAWFYKIMNGLEVGYVYLSLGTNSIDANDAFGTPAKIWDQCKDMFDHCIKKGIIPIIKTISAVKAAQWSRAASAPYKAAWLNNKFRGYCLDNIDSVILIDTYKTTVDPASTTGEPKANYIIDNVHPASITAQADGFDLAESVKRLVGPAVVTHRNLLANINYCPSQLDDWDSCNAAGFPEFALQMLQNPALLGTGGTSGTGITGTAMPDGWTCNRVGTGAAVNTASTLTNGQGKLSLAITATANDDGINLIQNALHTRLNSHIGKRVVFGLRVKTISTTLLKELQLQVRQFHTGDESGTPWPYQRILANNQTASGASLGSMNEELLLISDPFLLSKTMTGCQFDLTVSYYAGGGGTVEISEPFMFLID